VRQFIKNWRWPILIGLAGWLAAALTRTDPGITSDEPFSVIFGIDFVSRLSERGWQFFSQQSLDETFTFRSEHPPLGRWIIGGVHRLVSRNHDANYGIQDILDARFAPATAFALTLVILTRVVTRRLGDVAGVSSGVSLLLMPHSFAHAHFAALDTFVSLTYLVAVLSAAWMMERRWPWLAAPLAGVFLGLVLLTKIHGFFVPAVVGLWAIASYRFQSLVPLVVWSLTGLLIFFVGWPWLWNDLHQVWSGLNGDAVEKYFPRLSSFLASSVDRAPIYVSYFDSVFRDSAVPWHYPWVMFVVAVPIGIQLLALCGVQHHVLRRRDDRAGSLYLAAILLPLLTFSIPGVPVYDGVRLFLMVFPFWAALAGLGASRVFDWLRERSGRVAASSVLALFLGAQATGILYYHPFELSYYNLLTGGLRGAARMGFEVTYWGDSVTTDLLDRWSASAPENSCALLVPTLYEGQVELYQSSGTLKKRQKVVDRPKANCPYVIIYNRRAYLDSVRDLLEDPNQKPLCENAKDGVWLARVYVRVPPKP
jgi:4-amino-4-deoxy-L-arabinose transferase-like glycosyltransferase